jgi:cell division protease FtsH
VAGTIDDEVKKLIDKAYDHCKSILKRDEEKLRKVVDFLMEKETMTGQQFADCMEGKEIKEDDSKTILFDSFTEE